MHADELRSVLDALDDGFCIIDVLLDGSGTRAIDYRFVELNPSFARQTGLADAIGRTARELVPDLDEHWYERYGRIALTGEPERFERHEPAMQRWFDVQAMRVGAPEQRRVAVLFRDITARREAEAALRGSETRFRRLFESNLLGVMFWDFTGRVHDGNDELLRMLGYDRADLEAGEIHRGRIAPPDPVGDQRVVEQLRRTGFRAPNERQLIRKDGTSLWVLMGTAAIDERHGVSFIIDITLRKEAEQRAQEAAARAEAERAVLDAILEAAPAAIVLADANGKLLRMNPANERLWGHAPLSENIDGYAEWKGWWADQSERRGQRVEPHEWAMARALRGETARDDIVEIEPFGRPGVRRIMVNSGAPVRDAEGHITGAVVAQMDITELVEAEQALREADRRKDQFIAMLAHELRNPLAPIRNAVEFLHLAGPPDPKLQRARDVIDRQVGHMARLIDDLLDVSRIARGKLVIQRETCDLAAIARQAAEDYRAGLEAAGLTLVVLGDTAGAWVEGDQVRLAQLIGNLLHNASRFTNRGGRVEVRTEVDEANRVATVSVKDTGIGIDPALLSRLFDPFSQADQDLARSKGGLGLGLALTKGLAELHGGGVTASSEGPGYGSTFSVRIPLSKVRRRSERRADAQASRRGLRIVVIEDNQDAAETLGELLELAGHRVKLAFDGVSGVAAAREHAPDVVISDIGLPGELDGYGVAQALRADPTLRGVYLIALSGYANEEARRRSRDAGFDAHLAKPATVAALQRLIAEVPTRSSSH